ncbi:SAICAR synthase-like protein [Gymnopus androsaceus JB14]|uniref:Kinase n=1 Tax=Gymnopus androsaceus JB14 TaxID=1447944 RepID=A0A6A4I6S4_9AGAR|nr:SAICAR synthase-like protein [Gymnopus androsaceus JB14]
MSADSLSSGFTQVGGHLGSISTAEDGSLVIKQASPLEQEFYAIMAQARAMPDSNSDSDSNSKVLRNLSKLSKFVPQFYGMLRLEGELDVQAMQGIVEGASGIALKDVKHTEVEKESLVLENLLYPFFKPNILDLKLGRVLYDEDASEEKKIRMRKVARATTSGECGMRLTGFQVHSQSPSFPGPIFTPKTYGKSIRKDQLPEGIARVFSTSSSSKGASQVSTTSRHIESASIDPNVGLSVETLLPTLRAIHGSTAHLRDILASLEIRIVGGSLLVVYEGDEDEARKAVEWMKERERLMEEEDVGNIPSGEEKEDSEHEDNSEVSRRKRISSPPYTIKLIDFAHTRFVPGQGPDEGVLLGLDTFLGLIERRIEEVKLMRGC